MTKAIGTEKDELVYRIGFLSEKHNSRQPGETAIYIARVDSVGLVFTATTM